MLPAAQHAAAEVEAVICEAVMQPLAHGPLDNEEVVEGEAGVAEVHPMLVPVLTTAPIHPLVEWQLQPPPAI